MPGRNEGPGQYPEEVPPLKPFRLLRPTRPRAILPLFLGIVFLVCAAPAARALEVDRDEVALRFVETQQGARLVLEFAERPDYQVRQEPGRVVVALQGSFKSIPYKSRNLDHPAVGRFKLDRGTRQTELIFQTGPEFAAVSSFEMTGPFRLVLDFIRRAALPPGVPPETGLPATPPGSEGAPAAQPPVEPPGAPAPPRPGGIQTIVVDPGHGGGETGAKGPSGLLEKDIALDVARRVQQGLSKRLGVRVVLTRESDRQVALDERTAIANHNRADLFLSIHANASNVREARGAETYFLSYQATDDESRTLAALENNSAGVSTPPGSTNLQLVLWDLAQSQYLAESSQLAETIQQNLNELLSIQSRGIKQAPFRVLMGATMPAVLVEIGFITNAEEEAKLKDPGYRERIAAAIVDSVATFKERSEKRQGPR